MPLSTAYSTGTASINANETIVTGQGTTWLTYGLQAGDIFWAGGVSCRIASVDSNTQLTLAFPWPGATRTAASYEVRLTPETSRVLESARAVLNSLNKRCPRCVCRADRSGQQTALLHGRRHHGADGFLAVCAHAFG